MNEIESLAVSEPLNAKTLTLSTVANEDLGNKEKWDALRAEGRLEPKVCSFHLVEGLDLGRIKDC